MGRLDHYGFWRHSLAQPDRTALIPSEGGATTSFGQLRDLTRRYRVALRGAGAAPGDTVTVMLPNGAHYAAAYFAAIEDALYLTPINYHLLADEVAYIVSDSGAKAFVASAEFAGVAVAAADAAGLPAVARLTPDGLDGFGQVTQLGDAGEPVDLPADHPTGALMMYTSGTTGRPKGVRRPLPEVADIAPSAQMAGILMGNPPLAGIHLVCGPFYHLGPFTPAMTALHHARTVLVTTRFTARAVLSLVESHRVQSVFMVPTHFHRLLQLPPEVRDGADLSSLRHVLHSAAPCSVELKRRMIEWLGPILHESYAATEAGGTYVTSEDWLAHPGTVGKVWEGSQVFIVDEDGNLCPPGTPGSVVFEPSSASFEYLNDLAKTSSVKDRNRVKVGDIGYLDDEGYLFLAGRRSDMIISGGVNIYPAEIEARLLEHPSVRDAAVIGIPDEEWGERVHAVIEVVPGTDASDLLAQDLIAYCRSHLAAYKCPRTVEFSADLPRTDAGKIYKRRLQVTPAGPAPTHPAPTGP